MGVVTRDMTQEHTYTTTIAWTGNKGTGTVAYDDYARGYEIACDGKVTIRGSADPKRLHMKANKMCYIARSVNFPVHHEPEIVLAHDNLNC